MHADGVADVRSEAPPGVVGCRLDVHISKHLICAYGMMLGLLLVMQGLQVSHDGHVVLELSIMRNAYMRMAALGGKDVAKVRSNDLCGGLACVGNVRSAFTECQCICSDKQINNCT